MTYTLQELKKDFTIVKGENKKEWIKKHTIKGDTLYSVYKSWSEDKEKAFNNCVKLAIKYGYITRGVTGGNSSYFTYMFTFEDDKNHYIAVITYSNNWLLIEEA